MKKLLILTLSFFFFLQTLNPSPAEAAQSTSACNTNGRNLPVSLDVASTDEDGVYTGVLKINRNSEQTPVLQENIYIATAIFNYEADGTDPQAFVLYLGQGTREGNQIVFNFSLPRSNFEGNFVNTTNLAIDIYTPKTDEDQSQQNNILRVLNDQNYNKLVVASTFLQSTGINLRELFNTTCTFNIDAVFSTQAAPDPNDPNAAPNSCTTSVQYFPRQVTRIPGLDGLASQVIETRAPYALLKIEGIEKNPELRRGVKIVDRNNQNKLFADYCYPQDDLINGIVLPNPYGNKYWYSGRYDITVTERCAVWLESPAAQGSPICYDESRPTVLSIGEGTPLLEGDSCVVNGPRKCDKSAPHCVASGYGENEGICKTKPNVGNFCDTKKGYCSTIFGKLYFSPAGFARSTLTFLLSISGGILLIYLIISGYKLMTSQGDPDKIKDAREAVTAAIAGLLLIIFSIAILQLVTDDILGLPGFR